MQNIVSLRSDHPRPRKAFGVPRSGARILFFTGVRYCRDEGSDAPNAPCTAVHIPLRSEQRIDAAAH